MKVGDYVRTKDYLDNQLISKIKELYEDDCIETDKGYWDNEHIIKSSPNIIDLIEVGDIIREKDNHLFEVYAVGSDCVYINNLEEFILIKDIKSIVTKEQFSQMEYRIGE